MTLWLAQRITRSNATDELLVLSRQDSPRFRAHYGVGRPIRCALRHH